MTETVSPLSFSEPQSEVLLTINSFSAPGRLLHLPRVRILTQVISLMDSPDLLPHFRNEAEYDFVTLIGPRYHLAQILTIS